MSAAKNKNKTDLISLYNKTRVFGARRFEFWLCHLLLTVFGLYRLLPELHCMDNYNNSNDSHNSTKWVSDITVRTKDLTFLAID